MTDTNTDKDVSKDMIDLALGNIKPADLPGGEELEMMEWVFTNDPKNPMPRQLFHLFMEGAFKNKIGVMHVLHEPTGEVHTVLCGIEITENGPVAWPLAKILVEQEQAEYRAPDGKGGYVGYVPA